IHGYINDEQLNDLLPLSNHFGLALQKVNILKDMQDDVEEGRCYWPSSLLKKHGLSHDSLLEPAQHRQAIHRALKELRKNIQCDIEKSLEYIQLLPFEPKGVRIFCGDNLMFAIATVSAISNDRPKISREDVLRIDNEVERIMSERKGFEELASQLNRM
ncbi:MAG: squalene/phytoene synthase family protein, partial [Nanoarchaeota archaeon]